jgi:hypothetical protein
MLDGTVRGQLGGTVTMASLVSGLACDIEVPLGRLAGASPSDLPVE